MEPLERYTRISQLLRDVPESDGAQELSAEERQWIARGLALVEDDGNMHDQLDYRRGADNARTWPNRDNGFARMALALENCMARAELRLPLDQRGAFIQAGNAFDAFQAVGRVFGEARRDLLIVDPYLDHTFLRDFAQLVPEGVLTRALRDSARTGLTDPLRESVRRWGEQFAGLRPLAIRSAAPRTLHDRLIVVDQSQVYLVSQSLKDLAARAHASLQRADQSLADAKREAYEEIWANSQDLLAE